MNGHNTACRMCKQERLKPYLDLGHHPPSDEFRTEEELKKPLVSFPLEVCLCENCGLSQLSYVVPPEILYQNDYPYMSSTTATGRKHYHDFASSVVSRLVLGPDDLVVDVGSNVGVLLDGFRQEGTKILGIDPAPNIVEIANRRGVETICEFFNPKAARKAKKLKGQASVITGTNVFAHVDNLHEFMKAVDILLKEDGVFIFESPTLLSLVDNNAYSSVYHEHLSYLSLEPVVRFMDSIGFEVFHVETRDIHEGSFRVFVARKGVKEVDLTVGDLLKREEESGIHSLEFLKLFAEDAYNHLDALRIFIHDAFEKGEKICLLSAPAKGMTLVNALKLDVDVIDFATERTELKVGRYCPGTRIPVFGDEDLLKKKPDYAILLAWNFKDEIAKNNQEYLDSGGKFIVPFPKIEII